MFWQVYKLPHHISPIKFWWKILKRNIIFEAKIALDKRKQTLNNVFNNQTKSFNYQHYENNTELSKEYKSRKSRNVTEKIIWRIVRKCASFNAGKRKCYLGLNKKLKITSYKEDKLLNKCRIKQVTLLRHDGKGKSNVSTKTSHPLFSLKLLLSSA